MKKSIIRTEESHGQHPLGAAQTANRMLRAGAKGTGQILASCIYWPWSHSSCKASWDYLTQAAQNMGYEVVTEPE